MIHQVKHTIESCGCIEKDMRKSVGCFYEIDESNTIRCSQCGCIPPEIMGHVPPLVEYVKLTIYQRIDDRITRQFTEQHWLDAND